MLISKMKLVVRNSNLTYLFAYRENFVSNLLKGLRKTFIFSLGSSPA